MRLAELLYGTSPDILEGIPDVDVRSIAYDSRRVEPGAVFFALQGEKSDGTNFIGEAARRGAVACVADRDPAGRPQIACFCVPDARQAMAAAADIFFGRPSLGLTIVGVTGTNGKTTTTYMLDSIFRSAGKTSGLLGTIQYRFAGESDTASRTTPESVDLQAMFRRHLDAGGTHVAMEVSSHALELKRVHAMRFAAAVFTNLTQDHLDFHRGMEPYLRAKLRLFEMLPEEAIAVVNRDSPHCGTVAAASRSGHVVTFGFDPLADVGIENCTLGVSGFEGTLRSPWGSPRIASHLLGRFNVSNALGALAAACAVGIPLERAVEGIAAMSEVPGRVERIDLGYFSAVVDYAHSPDALDNVLGSLRPLTKGRLLVVFGCGGDRDRGKRPLMAAAVARHADFAVLTSDNPRSENPYTIMEDAEEGFGTFQAYRRLVDRQQAICLALGEADEGDLVVIAGKGHEDYQILRDQTIHFSDREVVEDWRRQKLTPAGTARSNLEF